MMYEREKDPRYEQVARDVRKLADSVGMLVGEKIAEKRETMRYSSDVAKERMNDMKKMAKERGQQVDAYAREHVWTTAIISAAVGMIIASLFRRRRY